MLGSVAHQWASVIGERRVSAAEVIQIATKFNSESEPDRKRFANDAFREALLVIAGNGGAIDSGRLGTWLGRNKDRIVDGKKIIRDGILTGNNQWRLIHVASSSSGRAGEFSPLQTVT
jgi:putative DNA primase/helicase